MGLPQELTDHERGQQLLSGQITWRQIVGQLPGSGVLVGKRILGAIRLSEFGGQDDPTTSPIRQRMVIEGRLWREIHRYQERQRQH